MTELRVLLVDDEEDFVDALSKRLALRGLKVETVFGGVQALAKVVDQVFDAIVLDLAMPDMDGLETMKRLLLQKPDLPIILLTGKATPKAYAEATKSGAAEFLEKPAEIDELLAKIKGVQARRLVILQGNSHETIAEWLKDQS